MKILIIGRGAREHCMAWKCQQSKLVSKVYVAKGNDAMSKIATVVDIEETNIQGLLSFALEEKIDLTIAGTEVPLELGLTNIFSLHGLKIFAPSQEAAQIETSKDFAKKIMLEAGIKTAAFKTFDDFEAAKKYVEENKAPIVIKNDGLAAGKGVVVAMTETEAIAALALFLNNKKEGNKKVVIEEFLEGEEFTLMCLVHKNRYLALPLSQDHKRAFDNDKGPNTGGMGAYSGVPQIHCYDEAIESVIKPMINQMNKSNIPFTGFLYAGLMMTKQGLRVIEFNARFGDPECEVLLPILDNDIVASILSIMDEDNIFTSGKLPSDLHSLGVVIASKGYPGEIEKGNKIVFPENNDVLIFHAGTRWNQNHFESNGGRVAVIVGVEKELEQARKKVYEYITSMNLSDSFFYRKDIGKRALDHISK